MNVYNEIDPFACDWLESLIAHGLIPPGRVERRSIAELEGADLEGATQVHFFAGIAGWSEALRLAGVPADFPIWTGSCPCQPFSSAGKRKGTADERHLWPEMFRLVRECRPAAVVGEQVAGGAGWAWCAGVRADLEGIGYRFRACELPACGVGAPHRRQRLFWVADLHDPEHDEQQGEDGTTDCGTVAGWAVVRVAGRGAALAVADLHESRADAFPATGGPRGATGERGAARPLGDAERAEPGTGDAGVEGGSRCGRGGLADDGGWRPVVFSADCDPDGDGLCPYCGIDYGECPCIGPTEDECEYVERDGVLYGRRVGDAECPRPQGHAGHGDDGDEPGRIDALAGGPASATGAWADCWLAHCRDGKSRRVGAGLHPLAHGIPRGLGQGEPELRSVVRGARANRVGRLKGFGNAIVPPLAAAFLRAVLGGNGED